MIDKDMMDKVRPTWYALGWGGQDTCINERIKQEKQRGQTMNNAVVKHIREQVEKLTFDIEMLGHQVMIAEGDLKSKVRKLGEARVLRDELAMMISDIPESLLQSMGLGSSK